MTSAALLNADERCRRLASLSQSFQRHVMSPMQALYEAVEVGLESYSDDPGQSASDYLMSLAVDRGFDTIQTDLLGHSSHLASIADMATWILRPDAPWERPADLGGWESSCFTNELGSRLVRLVICDRWTEDRALAEAQDWRTQGEVCIYGLPMDIIIVALGSNRDGRRHGPLSKGYLHPVNHDLRFQKRDGESFGPTWERVFREKYKGTREDWLQAMTEDGVLTDAILTHTVEVPERREGLRDMALRKLDRIRTTKQIPEPQFSVCHSATGWCPFHTECRAWRLPSVHGGFVAL